MVRTFEVNKVYLVNENDEDILISIGKNKGCLTKNSEVDIDKTCEMFLADIRNKLIAMHIKEKYFSDFSVFDKTQKKKYMLTAFSLGCLSVFFILTQAENQLIFSQLDECQET